MVKKYAIYPGYVTSSSDGEQHYIGGDDLMRLSMIPYNECVTVLDPCNNPERFNHLIQIRPRADGLYFEAILRDPLYAVLNPIEERLRVRPGRTVQLEDRVSQLEQAVIRLQNARS